MGTRYDGARVAYSNGQNHWSTGGSGGGIWTIGSTLGTGTNHPISGSQVWGISAEGGFALGQTLAMVNGVNTPVPAYWSASTKTWTKLPMPSSTVYISSAWPEAVDASYGNATIAGWTSVGASPNTTFRAIVWDKDATTGVYTPTNLSAIPSTVAGQHTNNIVRAISYDGNTVVGYYADGTNCPAYWNRPAVGSPWVAARLTSGTSKVQGQATSVSKNGTWIAGGMNAIGTSIASSTRGLFKYNRGTKAFTNLGSCATDVNGAYGGDGMHAAYVSDDGNTVAGTVCDGLNCTACVWSSTGGMKTLSAYLTSKGVSVGGAGSATGITGMSSDGKVIAISGTTPGLFVTP
jgi:hypothetical protein